MRNRRLALAIGSYALVASACFGAVRWFEPVRVSGGSMHPALHAGDLALVSRGAQVDRGDVALLRPPGRGPVLHRVEAILDDGSVLTKGDANEIGDLAPTRRQQVAGKVVAVVPVGRLLERWR